MYCPNHGIGEVDQLYIFLGGLKGQTKVMLDVVAGEGIIKYKTLEEAMELIENVAANDFGAQHDKVSNGVEFSGCYFGLGGGT